MALWKRHFLGLEAALVVALTSLLAGWMLLLDGTSHVQEFMHGNRVNIYRTTASIAGTLLGFSITGASLALSYSSSPRLVLLRNSAHYPTLWKSFVQATRFLGTLTITALAGLVWDRENAQVVWLFIPLCLFFGLSVVRLIRVIWILEQIIKIISRP